MSRRQEQRGHSGGLGSFGLGSKGLRNRHQPHPRTKYRQSRPHVVTGPALKRIKRDAAERARPLSSTGEGLLSSSCPEHRSLVRR